MANKLRLQPLVSYDLRERFGLASQIVIRAIAKVSQASTRDRTIPPHFRRHGARTSDQRIGAVPTPDRVALLTRNGWVVVPVRFEGYAEGRRHRTRGQGDLRYRKRSATCFLAITVDAPEPTPEPTPELAPEEATDYLGVDLGVMTPAATA